MQAQRTDAVVAAHDVEPQVVGNFIETVLKPLRCIAAGERFANPGHRMSPTPTVGQSVANFDLLGRGMLTQDRSVGLQLKITVARHSGHEFTVALLKTHHRQLHQAWPRRRTELQALEPKSKSLGLQESKRYDGADESDCYA